MEEGVGPGTKRWEMKRAQSLGVESCPPQIYMALLVTFDSVQHGQTTIKHDINERGIWQDIGDRGEGREFAQ